MTAIECPRESDVLDAIASKRWPHRVVRELADHVASCAPCTDVVAVATAIHADQEASWQDAAIPSSGQVWWRAEMRVRQEAIRKASRPIAIVQAAAVLVALALTGAAGWLAWMWARQAPTSFDIGNASARAMSSPLALSLAVALFALAVIAPVAFYLVLSDE
jgi:hypothetical protein